MYPIMGTKLYGVIDCDTLNCFGAYLTLDDAIRKGYLYGGWTPGHGFQVVEWDSDNSVSWGYNDIKFVSIPDGCSSGCV